MTPVARYDTVADFYTDFAPDTYDDPTMVALLDLVGDVRGQRVLDLACGHGRLTRELARRGAQVIGLDISTVLIEKARAQERTALLGVTYLQADAAATATLAGERFDQVTCCFGLLDIDDLDGALATVARVLRPGGNFTFSTLHPCFPGSPAHDAPPSWPPGCGYYDEGWWLSDRPAHGIRPRVGSNHRTLSTYVNTLVRHGLVIAALAEPPPSRHWLETATGEDPVPFHLVARCRRMETVLTNP
jgi:2-polyprenyl-3-methyl-5-hydroxy-6-metoxy-1,4-benzoquinol methylase